jgi:hypothetical protein
MLILKLRRIKLGSILTTLDPTLPVPIEDQRKAVANFATKAPRVFVNGPEAPAKAPGIRHQPTPPKAKISQLLGTYMQSIPGAEVVMLAAPDLLITGEVGPLLAYVDSQRMELAWGCNLNVDGKPSAFILSSQVVAHLMNDLPQGMTFEADWKTWVHEWMKRLLRQRYFDASDYGIITGFPTETPPTVDPAMVELAAQVQDLKMVYAAPKEPPPPKPKRGNVRRVKVPQ